MGQAKHRSYRRFFQFSVRSLVLAATLLCVTLGGGLLWWRWPFELEHTFVVMDDWDSIFIGRREGRHMESLRPGIKKGGCREVYRVYRHLRGLSVAQVRHGPATVFDALGNMLREDNWSHGKLEGKLTEWNPDGTVLVEGEFRNGYRHGAWVWHKIIDPRFPSLRKRFISYRDGVVLQDIKHTDDDVTTEEWNWDESALEVRTVQQSRTGQTLEEYAELATPTTAGGERFLQPIGHHGPHRRWYPSGQKHEDLTYDHGRRVGKARGWHADGTPWYQGTWKDGLEDGHWTWWNEDATVAYQVELRDGRLLRPGGTLMPDFQPQSEAERGQSERVLSELRKETLMEFTETPLKDVLQFLSDLHGVKFVPDVRVLIAADIDLCLILISWKTPLAGKTSGMSFGAALQIMLQPHDLAFLVRNNQIVITTRAEAERLAKETP